MKLSNCNGNVWGLEGLFLIIIERSVVGNINTIILLIAEASDFLKVSFKFAS